MANPAETRIAWNKQRRSPAESLLLIESDVETATVVERRLRRLGYVVVVQSDLRLAATGSADVSLVLANQSLLAAWSGAIHRKVHLGRDVPAYVSLNNLFLASSSPTNSGAEQSDLDQLEKRFAQNFADLARNRKPLHVTQALCVDDLVIDLARQTLTCSGRTHVLHPQEAALLALLVQHPAEPLSYQFIADGAWPTEACVSRLTMAVHVRWLRQKIESDPSAPTRIKTVRGQGYVYYPPGMNPK